MVMLILKPSILYKDGKAFFIVTQKEEITDGGGNILWDAPIQIIKKEIPFYSNEEFWQAIDRKIDLLTKSLRNTPSAKVAPITPSEKKVYDALFLSED